MAKKEFKFKDLDTSKLPKTVGKKVDGFRFYDIDGKAYPSVTTVLVSDQKKVYKSGVIVLVNKLPIGK